MWLHHPDCKALVAQTWNEAVVGSPSLHIAEKLCRLKNKLKSWNWNTFGDLKVLIDQSQCKIEDFEDRIHLQWDSMTAEEICSCKAELQKLLCWESHLFTRAKCLHDGDRNTSFFFIQLFGTTKTQFYWFASTGWGDGI